MIKQNEIIEKPKLGFFQRIRKALLMRNINSIKYNKAPEYLKNDEEVVDALLAINSDNLPVKKQVQYYTKSKLCHILIILQLFQIIFV